ncbi:MAG TPA: UGSC family (seleno)protein, partial [Burkholderiales bacterium]|nr:UGSC family (seleno)protein [Burkholderiales bacterium]
MTDLSQFLEAPGVAIEAEDNFDAINTLMLERGWGDGLPVVPPTAERVENMLGYCDRGWTEPIAKIAPRYGEATPLRLAANAVMAGCRPEYFPLYMLAIEAMCEGPFNLYGIQATTHPCAPLVIVNGPIGLELGINSGHNAFGPGTHGNATIGRAIRLALLNIGGALPGSGDMSTQGAPSKYSFLVAENEEGNPWEPLHVERGFERDMTTVTVIGCEGPHNINDHESLSGEGILTTIAGTMATTGNNDTYYDAQPLVVLGPEHAQTIAKDGYSKADVKRFLQAHAKLPLNHFSKENIQRRFRTTLKDRYGDAPLDTLI